MQLQRMACRSALPPVVVEGLHFRLRMHIAWSAVDAAVDAMGRDAVCDDAVLPGCRRTPLPVCDAFLSDQVLAAAPLL